VAISISVIELIYQLLEPAATEIGRANLCLIGKYARTYIETSFDSIE
jgi:hypothetical protein